MAFVTAALGILLYFLVSRYPYATGAVVLVMTVLGLAALLVGYLIGAAHPKRAAIAFQLTFLLPLTIGAVAAAALLALTIYIAAKTEKPSPTVEGIASAILAVLGGVAEKFAAMKRLLPASIAKWAVHCRYHKQFPQLHGGDRPEYVQAYKAIHDDPLSDSNGQISGWGLKSRRRRLTLIREALNASQP